LVEQGDGAFGNVLHVLTDCHAALAMTAWFSASLRGGFLNIHMININFVPTWQSAGTGSWLNKVMVLLVMFFMC
jgi:hypothetical protein